MSLSISNQSRMMPASAIRKLVPLADAAKAQGVGVYHLNVGAPDIKSPDCAIEEVVRRCKGLHNLSYTNSPASWNSGRPWWRNTTAGSA